MPRDTVIGKRSPVHLSHVRCYIEFNMDKNDCEEHISYVVFTMAHTV